MGRIVTLSTAGSVDDGKSTLLGRLLVDSARLHEGALRSLATAEEDDFSQLIDGLASEREQGITIDVGWRHLQLGEQRFLLADAPGHEQYTRNLVTAASHADALLVLVDPTRIDFSAETPALMPQTYRHCLIANLLRIRYVGFVVNKLDLFDDPESVFLKTSVLLRQLIQQTHLKNHCVDIAILPASALLGENIVRPSIKFDWYLGDTVLNWLKCCHDQVAVVPTVPEPPVLSVQTTLRALGSSIAPFRGLAGRVAQGEFHVEQSVCVLPSGAVARVQSIFRHGEEVSRAYQGESVTLVLDRDLDVSRGNWLVDAKLFQAGAIAPRQSLRAHLVWLGEAPGVIGSTLLLKMGVQETLARLEALESQANADAFVRLEPSSTKAKHDIQLNEIHTVSIRLQDSVWQFADHQQALAWERFVLIQPRTWATLAAGVVIPTL